MKYLAICLIVISIFAQPLNVYSTVVHVQSSKGKYIQSSKAKSVKTLNKCALNLRKNTNSIHAVAAVKIGFKKNVWR